MNTAIMDCCSVDYAPPNKISVMSGPRHDLSECSEECEVDGSYTEFVETQWTKGSSRSSSELDKDSPSHIGSVLDGLEGTQEIGSDTESVVVNAPLHGPTTVRCVCICKKKGCKFVDRPFDAHSVRESPIAKVSARYRLVTWLSSLRPHRGSEFAAADQIDVSSKVHPEKKSKIIQMFRSKRFRSYRTPGGDTTSGPEDVAKKHYPGLNGARRHVLPGRLRECELSVPRCFGVMVGLAFVLLGMTYDHGVKHGVDNLLQDCWSWLRTSYMNFGDEFVSYNSLFFRMANRDVLYGEPYPKYGTTNAKNTTGNATSFKDAINKVDPKFLFVLEGLKLSVQVHFFSIDEDTNKFNPEVMVHDRGPLFFRISFRRTAGLHVDFVRERSNMTLQTPFHIYDLMKIITVSNEIPYFGMHMHDYLKTTPSALFNMIIKNLKLFNVDTTFLSSIKAQIQKRGRGFSRRIRRRYEVEKEEERTRHYIPSASTTEQPQKATAETVPGYTAAPVTTTRAAAGAATERLWWNTTSGLPFTTATTTVGRTRRSTEEPNLKKVAWRALTEMSRKIFLPLPLDTKKTVLLPVPFIEKNLTLRYRHSVSVLGLPGYQFILGNDVSKYGDPWDYQPHDLYPSLSYSRVKEDSGDDDSHQQRHRYNDKKKHQHHRHSKHQGTLEGDSYRRSFNEVLGVVDLEDLLVQSIGKHMLMGRQLTNFPFWLSPPHFLSLGNHLENIKSNVNARKSSNSSGIKNSGEQNSKDSLKNNVMVGLGGVSANESLHGSFIYYHPILGVPINASLAVQVGVRPPKGMLFSHKLVPIMWTRVQVEEVPRTLWYILWAACHLRETIMSSLIITGLLIITCSLTCRRKKRRQERPGSSA
ncbi:uncharacterized protein LOC135105229 [Scylla paramamosain]|uniref:uncharacterized protein LOC135105229 n=1 Tax=Scylla paramamosain TaxID=85552 RepID=UPI00308367F6